MVRDKLYIDNNLHTPKSEVAEGTNVKEFAVEDQPCTPQNPLRIEKPVTQQLSVSILSLSTLSVQAFNHKQQVFKQLLIVQIHLLLFKSFVRGEFS
jgi:hypothetical protein